MHKCNRGRPSVCDLWLLSSVKTSAILSVAILLMFCHFSERLTGLNETAIIMTLHLSIKMTILQKTQFEIEWKKTPISWQSNANISSQRNCSKE